MNPNLGFGIFCVVFYIPSELQTEGRVLRYMEWVNEHVVVGTHNMLAGWLRKSHLRLHDVVVVAVDQPAAGAGGVPQVPQIAKEAMKAARQRGRAEPQVKGWSH